MTKPKSAPSLDAFKTGIAHALSGIQVAPPEGAAPDTRGRWRPHSEKLHGHCTDIVRSGGRYVAGLPFDEQAMQKEARRYQTLCGAEQVLTEALRGVKAAKESTKAAMLDQTTQVLTALRCQEEDPRTPAADRTAIRTLAAPAWGLLTESASLLTAKVRATRGRNAGFRAAIDRLSSENEALRRTEEPAPPAPRATRRRASR